MHPDDARMRISRETIYRIARLVERQTRYVMLAGLGRDRRTEHMIEALKAQF